MSKTKKTKIDTIFVDCFSTVIFRKIKKNVVFKRWAEELYKKFNIPSKIIYKTFKRVNFKLCFKKLFTTFTLQEKFEIVLQKMFSKLQKQDKNLEQANFIEVATQTYIKKELECFSVNEKLLEYLIVQKKEGKKIYLVSDFYCTSQTIEYWFNCLNIKNVFDKIYSSSDFDKEKATTKIYKKLIKDLHLKPSSIVMYGDNIWSDILMAKVCGMNAKRVKKNSKRSFYEESK